MDKYILNNAFALIDKNFDKSNFSGPKTNEQIRYAENFLNLKFPESYKCFLSKYGAGDIFGVEIFGIIGDKELQYKSVPNALWLTYNLRKDIDEPLCENYIIVSDDPLGGYIVLNTDNEKIYSWNNWQKEELYVSFEKYLFETLQDMKD